MDCAKIAVMTGSDKTTKRLDRNVIALGLTSFFNDWSSEMIFPLLPIFMAEVLSIPMILIGFIDGLARSVASLLKLFAGYVSDRTGKRKVLAVTGYALSTAVKPLLAIAYTWPLVLFVRVADRFGKGIRTAPRDALIADVTAQHGRRGRSFGFHRAMDTTGASLGALTAFLLMRFVPDSPYRLVFLLAAVPGIVGLFCIVVGARERQAARTSATLRISWSALTPALKRLIAASTLFGLGNFTFTFFLLRARNMGVSVAMIPLVYVAYNIVYAGGSYHAGVLSDRIGRKRILVAGMVLYVLTAVGFGSADGPLSAWLLMILLGAHMALDDGPARALVGDLAPAELRGTALGAYHAGIGLVDFPAGLLAGFLWKSVSPQAVFLVGAGIATIALAVLATVGTESAQKIP